MMAGQQRGTGERTSSPTATTTGDDKSRMPKPDSKAGKDEKKPEPQEPTDIYHVVPPGSIMRGGQRIPPGELLELTEKEAKELGTAVAPGEPPTPPKPVEKRTSGKYRVKGPGSVLSGGVHHGPGAELTLSEADARSLGKAVEAI